MKVMNSNFYERTIKGVNLDEIHLSFLVWEDGRVYCFVDLQNNNLSYWFSTTTIDILKNVEKEINKLVETYNPEVFEEYINPDSSIYECFDGNIISNGFIRHYF